MPGCNNHQKTADPSRRTTAHTDWRGLLLGVVVSPQPNSVVCPETKKTTEALIVTRCLVQQISTTNWIMSHFSLSRPENCETRAYAVAGGRGLKKQPCTSHSPDRHWGGRGAECHFHFQPASAGRKAGATDPTGPTNHPPFHCTSAPARIWPQGLAGLGLAHKWGSGKHLVRRGSASLTKLMQAHSLFLVYPSERSLHTHTPEGRKTQKDPRKKRSLSLRLWQCAEAHTLDGDQPERSLPFPSRPHPGPGASTTHTTTRQSTLLSVSTAVGRASTSHPVSTRPALPANTLAHRHGGKREGKRHLTRKASPGLCSAAPKTRGPKLQKLAHLQKLAR